MFVFDFRCYPINTVLADPYQLDKKLREYYHRVRRSHYNSSDESGDDSDSSCSSDSDSDDSDSSDVSVVNTKCFVHVRLRLNNNKKTI